MYGEGQHLLRFVLIVTLRSLGRGKAFQHDLGSETQEQLDKHPLFGAKEEITGADGIPTNHL